jgi:hypothetical protein
MLSTRPLLPHLLFAPAQAAAEANVADGVGRVEMALKCKLGQVQMQTQALQDVLGAVNTEIAKLARTQQHIGSLQAHLQDKIVINRGRQQVRCPTAAAVAAVVVLIVVGVPGLAQSNPYCPHTRYTHAHTPQAVACCRRVYG